VVDDATGPAFDKAAALERTGGSEELLREVAGLFLEESPRLLDDLWGALAASDAEGVRRAAHALKGSVSNFEAPRATAAAAALEEAVQSAGSEEIRDRSRALGAEVLRLQAALMEWANRGRSAEGE